MSSNNCLAESPCGPVTSQANRHSILVNDLHRALDQLTSRLNPILSTNTNTGVNETPSTKAVSSCELFGKLLGSNDALNDALTRIEDLNSRVQL